MGAAKNLLSVLILLSADVIAVPAFADALSDCNQKKDHEQKPRRPGCSGWPPRIAQRISLNTTAPLPS